MKIGILSFWDTDHNYGQILQCYALQQFLKNLGHEVFHIRHTASGSVPLTKRIAALSRIIFRGNLPDYLRLLKEIKRNPDDVELWQRLKSAQNEENAQHPRGFEKFKARYIKYSDREYNRTEIFSDSPQVDCLIAGSDQVWGGPDKMFMMDFGARNVKRISYAASMGGAKLENKYLRSEFKRLLKKIDYVTLREQDGVELCRALGRTDAELVPDPVMLLDGEHYRSIAVKPTDTGEYVMIYMLGNPSAIKIDEVVGWCEANGLRYKYVAAQGQIDDYPKEYPNIDEWLGLIDGAKYVITNSFHGMVTSIVLNKQFLVIPTAGSVARMNSRLTSTLNPLQLEGRILGKGLDEVMTPIDYERVNKLLAAKRQEIKEKFTNWLK